MSKKESDMNDYIYDAEQHIDFNKIRSIIECNKEKELICFGGGTAAEILMRKLLCEYPISCFLDNNKRLWGTEIAGIPVVNPDVLNAKDKEKIIVLLLSKHVVDISAQLEEYGLEKDVHFFDIYGEFNIYFRVMKFEEGARQYLEHLKTIPNGEFSNIIYQEHPKIGVVCVAGMTKVAVWYAIEQCLILRRKGYRAICIVDSLKGFDDYIYFDGYAQVANIYIQYVLKQLKRICPDFEVLYIDPDKRKKLSDEDYSKLKYLAKKMVTWFDAWKDEVFLPQTDDRLQVAEEILYKNFEPIKAFFEQNSFDTINVFTGMHKHRCLYYYVSELYGIRMSTYDGNYGGPANYATNGISSWSGDLARILLEKWFTDEEYNILYRRAEEEFGKRTTSTYKDEGYNYQFVGAEQHMEDEKFYDIIFPLNIAWDAAALGLDYLFTDAMEWILETTKYIMENTDATVMIREHPAQAHTKGYNYINLSEELHELEQYGDRIWICKATDKINSYQYIRQCKVVLPYSSTVGLESVVLGKKIVVHTKCYYAAFDFANSCNSKEEYFSKIKYFYENDYVITDEEKKKATLLVSMLLHRHYRTVFTEAKTGWLTLSWVQLLKERGIDAIVDVIANDIPLVYRNMKDFLESEDKNKK